MVGWTFVLMILTFESGRAFQAVSVAKVNQDRGTISDIFGEVKDLGSANRFAAPGAKSQEE